MHHSRLECVSAATSQRFPHFVDLALAFLITLQGQEVACVLEKCHLLESTPAYQSVLQTERRGEVICYGQRVRSREGITVSWQQRWVRGWDSCGAVRVKMETEQQRIGRGVRICP